MSKHTPAAVIDRRAASHRSVLWIGLLGSLFLLAACGGDSTGPAPPPPPPPPAPPPPPPPSGDVEVSLELELNDVVVITDPDSMAFELPGAASAREYRVIVQSASKVGGGLWPVKLTGQVSSATASAGYVRASYGYAAPASARVQELLREEAEAVLERQRSGVETTRMQQRAWDELRRIGARVAPIGAKVAQAGAQAAQAAAGSGSAQARLAGVPSVGDEAEFIMPIGEDLSLDCDSTEKILQAEILSVGEHFVIARDMQGTDAFSAGDYAEIQAVLDDFIHPVDTEYFGETADIDENERVIVLITEEVNKLADLTGLLIFLGFFLPSDLFDPVDCPASNAGEIVYLRAPDPEGVFGDTTSVERAVEILKSTTSHEFQHLINAEQRSILGNSPFAASDDVWLNEGLSHMAEELVGLAVMGLSVRANLGIASAVSDVDAFNTYLLENFFNLGVTAGSDDGCDGWMVDPENSITINSPVVGNPPGCGSLTMRGWSYLFLRWLGDHFGPAGNGVIPGSNEQAFFRELTRGGPMHLTGPANIEQAVAAFGDSASWEELLADFLLMVAVDDLTGVSLPARSQLPTWDLRDLFRGLNENTGTGPAFPNPYPLKLEAVLFDDVDLDFSVRSASAKYFTFLATTTTPDYVIRVTDRAGEPLRANVGAQVTVVRLR